MSERCCVFQPFDNGPYDKRFDETLAPAILDAGLEPYRVDRDFGAAIPVDALHEQIKSAAICLADITTNNPNVMYEVGYAIASGQDVVLIRGPVKPEDHLPFNIQHRGVIEYKTDSRSDFEKLKSDITNKLTALRTKQDKVRDIVSASPVRSTEGLQPNEIAALAFIMANRDSESSTVGTHVIKNDMERAGYNSLATGLALARLVRIGYIESAEEHGYNDNTWMSYKILPIGEDWLLENQDKLELRVPEEKQRRMPSTRRLILEHLIADDDVPF